MVPTRAITKFDAITIAAILAVAIFWIAVSGSGLPGPGAILVLLVLVVLTLFLVGFAAWELVIIMERLSEHLDSMTRKILLTRRDLVPAKVGPAIGNPISVLLLFLVFLVYFSIMVVFFYGLGGEPFADPTRLMTAAFLGTCVLHFAGRSDNGRALSILLDFLIPFGIIAGLIDLSVFGPLTLLGWVSEHGLVVLVFFAAYYALDVLLQRATPEEQERGQEGLAGAY